MPASYVQLAPEQTGKKVQGYLNTISGLNVEAIPVVVVDSAGHTNSYVRVTENTGKKMQHFQNTIGGNIVHALAVVSVNSSGT